mgnify:CR=1 FL=1
MMNIDMNSPVDVRNAGMQALANALGPVGFVRFVQQFEKGYGDYTNEKYTKKDLSFEELDTLLKNIH